MNKQRKIDEKFMREAIRVAQKSKKLGDYPCGAVVTTPDYGVIWGINRVRAQQNPAAHAEVVAILAACRAYKNRHLPPHCTLYTTIAPCIMCLGICIWAKVSRVIYACSQKDMGMHSQKYNLRALGIEPKELYDKYLQKANPGMFIEGGILREQCLKLFEAD